MDSVSKLGKCWIFGIAMAVAAPAGATGNMDQSIDIYKETCSRLTQAQEQLDGIPQHLLGAISLAESGRWEAQSGAKFAWPWTITARGKGHFFPSKAEALSFARKLQSEGVRNIDFGCMQVNLIYHGDAFQSLADMIDPIQNVAYAAKHLTNLFERSGSWPRAAGNYHSFTPERARAYRLKVLGIWNEERRLAASRAGASGTSAVHQKGSYQVKPVDVQRTHALNAAFSRREVAAAPSEEGPDLTDQDPPAGTQMEIWRTTRDGNQLALNAKVSRLRAEADRQRELKQVDRPMERALFAQRRSEQLDRWRRQNGR